MIKLLGKVPDTICVAVSGGPDSMAALDFLRAGGKRKVTALYYNHGTRHGEEAKKFVRNYCFHNSIPCLDERIRRKKEDCESWEEYWRIERYKYFKKHSAVPIVTAHHLNDVAEWWIYTSLHGEGKVMPYRNEEHNIIRPFLLTPKKDLVSWCERKKVPYLTDPSNKTDAHMRNIVRHEIIPTALKVSPGLEKIMRKKVQKIFDIRKNLYKSDTKSVHLH